MFFRVILGDLEPGSVGEYGGSDPESGGLSGKLCLRTYLYSLIANQVELLIEMIDLFLLNFVYGSGPVNPGGYGGALAALTGGPGFPVT